MATVGVKGLTTDYIQTIEEALPFFDKLRDAYSAFDVL